eukprot:Seg5033.1 transcript_id=Seg5033.1/GoldUCD/mRNA.D3Y31 product="hypothetical protein" protein_id=Seg5033.1/GoldUCD/D3Y31
MAENRFEIIGEYNEALNCPACKITKKCNVPSCTFWGDRDEMMAHNVASYQKHYDDWTQEHRELHEAINRKETVLQRETITSIQTFKWKLQMPLQANGIRCRPTSCCGVLWVAAIRTNNGMHEFYLAHQANIGCTFKYKIDVQIMPARNSIFMRTSGIQHSLQPNTFLRTSMGRVVADLNNDVESVLIHITIAFVELCRK